MRSKFAIAGHPLHPALIALPVGLFIWTLVADIVFMASGKNHMWYDLAFWTGIAAMCSAIIAALPGFGDLFTMAWFTEARTNALIHMTFNLATVALFFIAMLLSLTDGAVTSGRITAVFILHLAGVGLLAFSGWLGGEMVYLHHLAMVPDAGQEQTEHSHHVMRPQYRPRL